jgi:hypothetical protein
MSGGEIPAGIDQALVVLSGNQAAAGRVTLVGEATVGGGAGIKRQAQAVAFASSETQPWLREELAVSANGKSSVAADWASEDESRNIPVGGKVAAAIKVSRAEGTTGPVRLTLITTQTVPTKTVDNKEVDDPSKALRAEAIVVVPPEAAEGSISIIAPADLKRLSYELVVQAELLSADGKQVLATTYTMPRRVAIVDPPPQ